MQRPWIQRARKGLLTAKSGIDYDVVKANYQKHDTDLSQLAEKFVKGFVDSYTKDGMDALYYEHNGTPCAFIYEERLDMDKTTVNLLYTLSDNVYVFFAVRTNRF